MGDSTEDTFQIDDEKFPTKFYLLVQYNRRQVSALEHSIGVGTMIFLACFVFTFIFTRSAWFFFFLAGPILFTDIACFKRHNPWIDWCVFISISKKYVGAVGSTVNTCHFIFNLLYTTLMRDVMRDVMRKILQQRHAPGPCKHAGQPSKLAMHVEEDAASFSPVFPRKSASLTDCHHILWLASCCVAQLTSLSRWLDGPLEETAFALPLSAPFRSNAMPSTTPWMMYGLTSGKPQATPTYTTPDAWATHRLLSFVQSLLLSPRVALAHYT